VVSLLLSFFRQLIHPRTVSDYRYLGRWAQADGTHTRAIRMVVDPKHFSARPNDWSRDENTIMKDNIKDLCGARKGMWFLVKVMLYDDLPNPSND
jgi:hypothetical protein